MHCVSALYLATTGFLTRGIPSTVPGIVVFGLSLYGQGWLQFHIPPPPLLVQCLAGVQGKRVHAQGLR